MERLDSILQTVLEKSQGQPQYRLHQLKAHWPDVVGERISEHSWPIKLERRRLLLGIDSSVWNQALFIKKNELLSRIVAFTTPYRIDEIKSIVAEKPAAWPPRRKIMKEALKEQELTEEKRLKIEEEANNRCKNITDESLRELLQKITIDLLVHNDN